MISGQFLPESIGSWQESTGKIRAVFDRNTASSHFRCFPVGSAEFPSSFLKDPEAGTIVLPRSSWWRRILSDGDKSRSVSVGNYQNLCGRIPTSGFDRTRAGFVQILPDFAGFCRIPTKFDDIRTGIRPQGLLLLGRF